MKTGINERPRANCVNGKIIYFLTMFVEKMFFFAKTFIIFFRVLLRVKILFFILFL